MPDLIVAVERIQQEKSYFCGAACAAMLLGWQGIEASQGDLFKEIDAGNLEPDDWHSDPQGLTKVLASLPGNPDPEPLVDSATFEEFAGAVCDALETLSKPSLLLVDAGSHWVVAVGEKSVEGPEGGRSIYGFYVQDPWFNLSPDRFISSDEARAHFTPVKFGAKWRARRVAVGWNAAPSSARAFVTPLSSQGGGNVTTLEGVALSGLEALGFEGVVPVAQGGGATTQEPVPVEDQEGGGGYYLVQLDGTNSSPYFDYIVAAISTAPGAKVLEVGPWRGGSLTWSALKCQAVVDEAFPGEKLLVAQNCIWRRGGLLRSRLEVARAFVRGEQELFVLPDGSIVPTLLREVLKGGGA